MTSVSCRAYLLNCNMKSAKRIVATLFCYVLMLPILIVIFCIVVPFRIISSAYLHIKFGASILVYASGIDSVWPAVDDRIVNVLLQFREAPALNDLRTLFHNQIIGRAGDQAGSTRDLIKLRGITRSECGRLFWIKDENFNIQYHIVEQTITSGRNYQELQNILSDFISMPFVADRPKWQLIIIKPSPSHSAADNGNTGESAITENSPHYCLLRFDHSICDGMSFMCIALRKFLTSTCFEVPTLQGSAKRGSTLSKVLLVLANGPNFIFKMLLGQRDENALHGRVLSGKKIIGWTKSFNTVNLKKVSRQFDCSVNDLLLSCLALAVSQLLKSQMTKQPPSVRVLVPVNMRHR